MIMASLKLDQRRTASKILNSDTLKVFMKLHITGFLLFAICVELLRISLILVKINGSFEVVSASFESCLEWVALTVCALSIILLIIRTL